MASLGTASDDADRELHDLLCDVEKAVRNDSALSVVVDHAGPMRLSDLFASAPPPVSSVRSPILWLFHQGSVATTLSSSRRLQALLRTVHKIGVAGNWKAPQSAFIVDEPSLGTSLLARLMLEAGVERVRRIADPREAVVTEARRPEGFILSLLSGSEFPVSAEAAPGGGLRALNERKDRAEAEQNGEYLQQLEEEERLHLIQRAKAAGITDTERSLVRAPRLCRMVLEAEHFRGGESLELLHEELLHREFPFFLMKHLPSGVIHQSSFGAVSSRAFAAYPDLTSLRWAADDLGIAPHSLGTLVIHPRKLFKMAAKDGLDIAMNAFRNRTAPEYLILPAKAVRALAQGIRPP